MESLHAKAETAWTCECSCAGKNHGGDGGTRWTWVSEDAEVMAAWEMVRHTYVIKARWA
ncbi:hypothetical protein SAMN05660657_05406 [Geodermatophilus amargosae]|uniref:Uncharacterized protein n=1 Tax=Geodermatophilus amargosae TaxID=1296565 RepID=A0A1I7D7G7_9ACTN|nr:hypothetical protein SAMN05660657_05406 [Geodermatophilus amargosae]